MIQQQGTFKSTFNKVWLSPVLLSLIGLLISPNRAMSQDYDDEVEATRLPASFGALGDSMSAAALAGYRRQDSIFPWVTIGLLVNALQYGVTQDLHSIEHRKYSWASGSSIPVMSMPSHLKRLSQIAGKSIPYFNASLSGAESDHVLNTQIVELRKWSREKLHQEFPDYVTLLIGANDLCAKEVGEMVMTPDFYSHVQQAVHEIVSTSPNTKVLLSSIPNVQKLRDVAKNAKVWGALSCEQVWKKAKLCATLTSLNDPEGRLMVANRLDEFNRALHVISEDERDVYGDRVRYAKHLFEADFTAKDLAIDCFHPNKEGQAKVAERTFASSWWKNEWVEKRADLKANFLAEQKRLCRADSTQHAASRPAICFESWKDPQ
jgi:lysophospholipase L1-like esterase